MNIIMYNKFRYINLDLFNKKEQDLLIHYVPKKKIK